MTPGLAGIRWDNVIEKVRKDMGRNKDKIMTIGGCEGYKTKVRHMI